MSEPIREKPDRSLDRTVTLIEAFIVRERGPLRRPIEPETQLLREGLLESIQVPRLARELATQLGITPDRGALGLEDFVTPRTIWESFQRFAPADEAPG